MCPLSMIEERKKVVIVDIRAGRGLSTRLAHMGFYPGVVIELVSNSRRGPLIVAKGGVRLALGFGMAHKIFVKPLKNEFENEGQK